MSLHMDLKATNEQKVGAVRAGAAKVEQRGAGGAGKAGKAGPGAKEGGGAACGVACGSGL